MDATQSFETFLLAVKLVYERQPTFTNNGSRRVSPGDFTLAEGLERVWRTWYDAFDEEVEALDSGFGDLELEEHGGNGKVLQRDTIATQDSSTKSLTIDQTIAKATLVLCRPTEGQSTSSERGKALYHKLSNYEFKWQDVWLDLARVVVAVEEAQKRKTSRVVLFVGGQLLPFLFA